MHVGGLVIDSHNAIPKSGAILSRVGPAGSGDNPDELPDNVIQEAQSSA
jgi:hypothetical protein